MKNFPAASATPRFDRIDLLRGLSILAVVLLHASLYVTFAGHPVGASLPRWLRYVLFRNGGNGVSVFFAISGFLITFTSIRRFGSLSCMRPKAFYRIRFARIAPLLCLLLFILSVLHLANVPGFRINPSTGSLPHALFAAVTFHLNWFEAAHGFLPACWTVLWSLSVEEMFYLFFPLLCMVLLLRRWGLAVFVMVLCGLVVFGPFARTPWYTKNELWAYQSYLGNMDNVALGCLFAMLANHLGNRSRFLKSQWPRIIEWMGAVLMLFIVFWDWPRVILGWHVKYAIGHTQTDVTVLGLGTCLMMLGRVLRPTAGRWGSAPLRWLGRYSYEVYLTHEFIVMGVLSLYLRMHRGPVELWIAVVVALSGLLGFLVSRFVSEPMNRWLRGAPVASELPSVLVYAQGGLEGEVAEFGAED